MDELKYKFTIDQIYLLYENCIKDSLTERRANLIGIANALIYTSQSMSKADVNKKHQSWKKYMDSLDWDTLEKKAKKHFTVKEFSNMFSGLGVMIKQRDKKKSEGE